MRPMVRVVGESVATTLVICCLVVGFLIAAQAPAAADTRGTTCGPIVSLQNGAFVPADNGPLVGIAASYPEASVAPWRSTGDQLVEVWTRVNAGTIPYAGSGTPYPSSTPQAAQRVAEIVAHDPGTLYQDVSTTPGQVINWQVWHHGRTGLDTGYVAFGPTLADVAWNGTRTAGTAPGAPYLQAIMSDSNPNTPATTAGLYGGGQPNPVSNAWGLYSGTYVVPPGQTTTFVAFGALTTSLGDLQAGNLIAGAQLRSAGCLDLAKAVTDAQGNNPAQAGDTLEYTLNVTNSGSEPVDDVVLSDVIPAGAAYVPGSLAVDGAPVTDAADGDQAEQLGGSVTFRVGSGSSGAAGGTLAPAQSAAATFRVTVLANMVDIHQPLPPIDNVATAGFTDIVSGQRRTATSNGVTTQVAQPVDLEVTKTDLTNVAGPGTLVAFTLTARNLGPGDATGVVLTDALDPRAAFVSSDSSMCTATGGLVTCLLSSLPNGASFSATITARVGAITPLGSTLSYLAAVRGDEPDPDLTNNSATLTGPVVAVTHLTLSKTGPATAIAGTSFDYEIALTNTGPLPAEDVLLTDALPPGLSAAAAITPQGDCSVADLARIDCSLGVLEVGAVIIRVQVTLPPDAPAGATLTNTATVDTLTADLDPPPPASVSTTVIATADVGVRVEAQGPATPGGPLTWTLVARNNGPSVAQGVIVMDVVPLGSGESVSAASASTGSCEILGSEVRCLVGVLPVGAQVTASITQLLAADRIEAPRSTATVSSSAPDPAPADNSATATAALVPSVSPSAEVSQGRGKLAMTGARVGPLAATALACLGFGALLTCLAACRRWAVK